MVYQGASSSNSLHLGKMKMSDSNVVNTFSRGDLMEANRFFFEGSGKVTLCGSTKYFFEYMEANRVLTFLNWIVLQCGSYGHSFHKYAKEEARDFSIVKKLHFYKIMESDAIVVCTDKTFYMGDSTKAEVKFAHDVVGIPVYYFIDGQLIGEDFVMNLPKREPHKSLTAFLLSYDGETGVNDPLK